MFKAICCNKKFTNKKSFTNHKRWHNIQKYAKFQNSIIKKMKKRNMRCLWNSWKGKHHSQTTICKLSIIKMEDKNPMWKGNKVGYYSLHEWIRNHKLKPLLCEQCKINPPYDLANINGLYKRNINDYKWFCRSCHMKYDYKNNLR